MIVEAVVRIAEGYKKRAIIAVSGPQGSGKTTSTKKAAEELTKTHGIPTAAVSIDDFYRPYSELQQLAHLSKNPLLQQRGLPGTHDVHALQKFLRDFLEGKHSLEVPKYDKSQHNGAGDRVGTTPLSDNTQCLLLEGWMVGFKPVLEEKLEQKLQYIRLAKLSVDVKLKDLEEINQNLKDYPPIWDLCSDFVLLVPEDLQYIYKWRLQQERDMIKVKGSGMSDMQVRAFVDQYMPCYFIYNETLPTKATVFYLDVNHGAHKQAFLP